jgi:hypothetical protein
MRRVSAAGLVQLTAGLSERDRQLVETVGQLRLVGGQQLERLFFREGQRAASRARAARRHLAALTTQDVLLRLERRIGGVRAGSGGYVYGLGPIGKRLVAYWHGDGFVRVRSPHEPGLRFVRHTLTVAEQYVRLEEAARAGGIELLAFDAEPACWRPLAGRQTLKPDAFVRLGVGEYEHRSFLEVDCGSEGRGALSTKCRRYVRYWQGGKEQAQSGVFPRVVWITTTRERERVLTEICSGVSPAGTPLFAVGTSEHTVALCSGADLASGGAP